MLRDVLTTFDDGCFDHFSSIGSLADAIAVSRDGRIVVSTGTDATIKVWPAAFLCKVIKYARQGVRGLTLTRGLT